MMKKDLTPIQQFAFEASKRCAVFNMRKTTRLIGQFYDQAFSSLGIRSTQYSLLLAIAYQGTATINQLAKIMGMDRTTVSRNVRLLSKDGLATIDKGNDRREHLISLTDAGQELVEQGIPLWEKTQTEFEQLLGKEWVDDLLGHLQKINRKMS